MGGTTTGGGGVQGDSERIDGDIPSGGGGIVAIGGGGKLGRCEIGGAAGRNDTGGGGGMPPEPSRVNAGGGCGIPIAWIDGGGGVGRAGGGARPNDIGARARDGTFSMLGVCTY